MSGSGLRNLKRSWSAQSNDLENDLGVVATKAQNPYDHPHTSDPKSVAQHQISNTSQTPLTEVKGNKKPEDHDFDDEFEEISFSEFHTPPFNRNATNKSSGSSTEIFKRSSESANNSTDSHCTSTSSDSVKANSLSHQNNKNNFHTENRKDFAKSSSFNNEKSEIKMPKRQLPDSFYDSHLGKEKVSKSSWAKSASELRSSKDTRASLFVKGTKLQESTRAGILETTKPPLASVFLSKEQQAVYDLVVTKGKSLFFTGSAGTGKSVCLREIIKGLRRKFESDTVAVTASTGIAACNISGITLHSFAGAGLCTEEHDKLVMKVKRNRKTASRWMRTKVLIIDEISMVAPELLDKLDKLAQTLRRSPKPFGGIQIVMTGDFFQLPPVNKSNQPTRYAFDGEFWKNMMDQDNQVRLTQVFRQKDPTFVNMLNELRFGQLSADTIKLFSSLEGESELQKSSKMSPTVLFPTRQEVDRANAMELVKIKKQHRTYDALDSGTLPPDMLRNALENFMAPKKLSLKMGCQVMLVKNLDSELVNGSIGTLLTFCSQFDYERSLISGFDWDSVDPNTMTEESINERLNDAYFQKRQEDRDRKNLDEFRYTGGEDDHDFEVDIKPAKESKPQSMDDLDKAIRRAESRERSRSRSVSPERRELPLYPVVRYILTGTTPRRYRTKLMMRETWSNEQPNGEITASRSQIPLILSWALSIHKSQGQTLPLVKIDLNKTFEKGQAYVALSRAVSKEGLQVLGFNAKKVRVDQRVVQFYSTLSTIKS